MTSVLLTRSAAQNQQLAQRLSQRITGFKGQIVSRPLLETRALVLDEPMKARALALDEVDDIFFISQNAVRFGLEVLEAFWPQWPIHLRWFAVGRATAEALKSAGIDCSFPAKSSSEDLLNLSDLSDVANRSALIVRGVGGRETLKRGLLARGVRVSYLEVYERLTIPYEAADFPDGEDVVGLVYSGEALSHLRKTAGPGVLSYHVIVPSERLKDLAVDLGFSEVTLANSQEDDAMLETLNHILGQQQ